MPMPMPLRVAYVTAAASLAAPLVGAVAERIDPPASAGSQPIVRVVGPGGRAAPRGAVCVVLERAVLAFAERHPEAARAYAEPGDSGLPQLATPAQRALCGDPEQLLERLPAPRG